MKRFLTVGGGVLAALLVWQFLNEPDELTRYKEANHLCNVSLFLNSEACNTANMLRVDLRRKGFSL